MPIRHLVYGLLIALVSSGLTLLEVSRRISAQEDRPSTFTTADQVNSEAERRQLAFLADKYGAAVKSRIVDGTQIDLLADEYAYAVVAPEYWARGAGECLFYALMTNKKAGLILLLDPEKQSSRSIARAGLVCEKYGIALKLEESLSAAAGSPSEPADAEQE